MNEETPPPPNRADPLAALGGREAIIPLIMQFVREEQAHQQLTKDALLDLSKRLRRMEDKIDAL